MLSLLFGAGTMLIGLLLTGSQVLRVQTKTKRVAERLHGVLTPHQPNRVLHYPILVRLGSRFGNGTLLERLSVLIGYDAAREKYYPVRWELVFLAAGAVVYAEIRVAAPMIGVSAVALAPLVWMFACRTFYGWCNRRVAKKLLEQFPDALAMIVRSVRVGIPVSESIRLVARECVDPSATEFGRIGDQIAIGVPLEAALRDLAERNQVPEYRFFATALVLQSQTGGGLTQTLEVLAETIRKRVAARQRGHALASEARTSALILGCLPVLTGTLLVFINPHYMRVLVDDPSGRFLFGLACSLLGTGIYVMHLLIRHSLS